MALSEVYIANLSRREIDRLVVANIRPIMTGVPQSDDDAQLRPQLTLTHLRDCCMARLELLETLDARRSLWVRVERDDA